VQTWIWPPAGAATPPIGATGNFGPVNIGDSIVLTREPSTKPEIDMTCFSESQEATRSVVAKLASPPLTYQFKDPANSNGSENIFCHIFFAQSTNGNTVTWQFLNQAGDKAVTWSASSGALSTAKPSSSTATESLSTMLTNSLSSATGVSSSSSSSSTATAQSASTGLSSGASAGIGIGVTLGALALAGLAFFLVRKKRRNQRRVSGLEQTTLSQEYYGQEQYGGKDSGLTKNHVAVSELDGAPAIHQMP